MKQTIIFHHYWASPFSEKVRLAFGIKNIEWHSVEIPNMMPKPDLLPLTGGYRKTPVMQIGADIFCDTQIILREIERRFPSPALFDEGQGVPYGLAFWADRIFFMATVGVVFDALGNQMPDAFRQDRTAMSPELFSAEALRAKAPFMRDQFRAHTGFIAEQLADGRAFIQGDGPTATDLHAHMNLWFLKSAVPSVADDVMTEFPRLGHWFARISAIGHGKHHKMDAGTALDIAREATPDAEPAEDPHDASGLKPGDQVSVAADDYGRDPVTGAIVFANAHEIAIRRSDARTGDVVVHFPRAGFNVIRAS